MPETTIPADLLEEFIEKGSNHEILEGFYRLNEELADRCERVAALVLSADPPPLEPLVAALVFTHQVEEVLLKAGSLGDGRFLNAWIRARDVCDDLEAAQAAAVAFA